MNVDKSIVMVRGGEVGWGFEGIEDARQLKYVPEFTCLGFVLMNLA